MYKAGIYQVVAAGAIGGIFLGALELGQALFGKYSWMADRPAVSPYEQYNMELGGFANDPNIPSNKDKSKNSNLSLEKEENTTEINHKTKEPNPLKNLGGFFGALSSDDNNENQQRPAFSKPKYL